MLLSKAKFVLRLVYFLLSRQIHNFVLNFKRKKFWILETDFVSRLEIIWQETKHSNATVSVEFNRENKSQLDIFSTAYKDIVELTFIYGHKYFVEFLV